MSERYVLRKAAGVSWLLDLKQGKEQYHEPLPMNEMGALIWKLKSEGKDEKDIVMELAKRYEEEVGVISLDVKQFCEKLDQWMRD